MNIKYIANDVAVLADTIKILADNGETGDECCELCSGVDPEFEHNGVASQTYWMETNGNPVLIGWIEGNSKASFLGNDLEDWIMKEQWLVSALESIGFDFDEFCLE